MHPLSYFDRIFIINLPSRSDRRREMDQQLRRIGLSLQHPLVELFAAFRPSEAGPFPSIGARGCFLSHLEVLRLAQKRRYTRVLLFEDDVNFAPRFDVQIEECIAALRAEPWDLFYGGYSLHRPWPLSKPLTSLPPDEDILLAHFLALSSSAVEASIDLLSTMLTRPSGHALGGPMHVDGAYNWVRRAHRDLLCRVAVPQLGYQRRSRTDIATLRWFDRLPGFRAAIATSRAFSNAITERFADATEEVG